ncbi:MAG: polysaccharide biosynthesis protein PslG [Solirubrobacteraceae bacterium]|jgi:hypothetical protein|nr:polysaccharide biosynthesis protein PslG [Solirubrobacteraceae bacterium]
MRFPTLLIALALAFALGGANASAKSAGPKRQVPPGFMGAVSDGPLDNPAIGLDGEYRLMVRTGVESIRVAFYWDVAQPYATSADVPPDQRARFRDAGGVPTDFAQSDRLVLAAARQGLSVLPVVLLAPVWARKHPEREWSPPSRPDTYARFVQALVRRYGPRGSFWAEHRRLTKIPIRDWQIWNEPNGPRFWDDEPPYGGVPNAAYQRPYIDLLHAAHDAIKAADPRARVVIAGFFGQSWYVLGFLYDFDRKVRRYFDVAAIHPFTAQPENVKFIVRSTRAVMNANGDRRKPLFLTEMSWPSAAGRPNQGFGFEVSESEQAKRLRAAYSLLVSGHPRFGVERIFWYTWASYDRAPETFSFAGLRRWNGRRLVSKPAFSAFRSTALALEGCPRGKRSVSRCR